MAAATNTSSKFTPFTLTLANDATVTGISHIPPLTTWRGDAKRPLIVALHGGTCTAQHYDISPDYTASTASEATGIPIVSIDRPCYGGTSSFLLKLPEETRENATFFGLTATWLHEYILPKIWETYGVPSECAGIVLLCHSLAVPPAILVAVMYANKSTASSKISSNERNAYPLAGLILSGFGEPETGNNRPTPIISENTNELSFSPDMKRLMMLSDPSLNCASPLMLPLLSAQNVPMPLSELLDMHSKWPSLWEAAAQQVEVPVLFRMGEHDWLWKTDDESMEAFKAAFTRCRRFDGGVVEGAPHALEMWTEAGKWYEAVFRFAEKCA